MQTPKRFKYVVIDSPVWGEYPILFPEFIEHGDVHKRPVEVISAGFCDITGGVEQTEGYAPTGVIVVSCFGESTSLNLRSRPNRDAELILKMMTEEIT